MKILHTESSCGWGGQEIRILEEARGLIKRGHEVSLICVPEARIYHEATRFGVPTQALPISRKNLKGLFALRRWLRQNSVDVINTHSSTDSWLTALACTTLRTPPPIVRTRHISSPIPNNAASRWLYAHAPSHVVTTGEALRVSLVTQFDLEPERVTSIPTGIDPKRFSPGDKMATRAKLGLDPAFNYIGIIATLRSWKGHRYLLDAFARLDAPNWRLLIVGSGPQQDALATQLASLELHSRAFLVGQKDDPQHWMQALDVFCLPSYANEGVPQAIMQAMFTALPIVTTPVGAILEAVTNRETALVVAPEDSNALVKALSELVHNKSLRTHLGKQAREQAVTRFTLDVMLDRMEQVFTRTIERTMHR